MTESLRARLAGADDDRCGAPCFDDALRRCDAKPHDATQAHIAADEDGNVILQWNELDSDDVRGSVT